MICDKRRPEKAFAANKFKTSSSCRSHSRCPTFAKREREKNPASPPTYAIKVMSHIKVPQ